jgi:hypothetical protein
VIQNQEKKSDPKLDQKIKSDEFITAITECIKSMNDNTVLNTENQLKTESEKAISRIKIFKINELKTHFVDSDNPENPFEDSEKVVNIARLKSEDEPNGIDFFIATEFDDLFEIYFFLAETILEAIKNHFRDCSFDAEFILNSLVKKSLRFTFLVMKLLRNKHANYEKIIYDYKNSSPFDII